jgi:hypothetical protein
MYDIIYKLEKKWYDMEAANIVLQKFSASTDNIQQPSGVIQSHIAMIITENDHLALCFDNEKENNKHLLKSNVFIDEN